MTLGAHRVEKGRNKTFHSFRHYACTTLGLFDDVKDKTIEDIVGHENKGTTLVEEEACRPLRCID